MVIVAKNVILLLDADQRFRAEGLLAEESMIRAGERRLRPIMMTALGTVASMILLALGLGAGSQNGRTHYRPGTPSSARCCSSSSRRSTWVARSRALSSVRPSTSYTSASRRARRLRP